MYWVEKVIPPLLDWLSLPHLQTITRRFSTSGLLYCHDDIKFSDIEVHKHNGWLSNFLFLTLPRSHSRREHWERLAFVFSLCRLQLFAFWVFPCPNQWLEYEKKLTDSINLAPVQTSSPSVTGKSVLLPVYPDLAIKGARFSFAGVASRYLVQTDSMFFQKMNWRWKSFKVQSFFFYISSHCKYT